jgi:hypothetical protein
LMPKAKPKAEPTAPAPAPAPTPTPKPPARNSAITRFLAACEKLKVLPSDIARQPLIQQYITTKLHFTESITIDYLRLSDKADAIAFLSAYDTDTLTATDRAVLPLEAYCAAAKIHPMSILEILVGTLVRLGAHESAAIAAIHQPMVVAKTVEQALEGHIGSQNILHKATGFLPSPKGSQTTIQIQQSQSQDQRQAAVTAVPAPPPEQTITRLVDRFNDARVLPESTSGESVPDIMPPVPNREPVPMYRVTESNPPDDADEDE